MGSGKSTVAALLRQRGFSVLDADQVVHQVLSPGGLAEASVIKAFGEGIRASDGSIDRKALGRIVFGSPDLLKRLEDILHPMVRQDVQRQREALAKAGEVAVFYDVPLLFEKKMEASFDAVLVVSADEASRHRRLFERSGLTAEEAVQRAKSQLPAEYKEARATFVIRNDSGHEQLEANVLSALRHLGVALPTA